MRQRGEEENGERSKRRSRLGDWSSKELAGEIVVENGGFNLIL